MLKKLEEIKVYLDKAIVFWRRRREQSTSNDSKLMADCYIDAFQSVRVSIFDELFPEKDDY